MRKALMIASMTTFVAIAAFANDTSIPQLPTTTEEIVGSPDDQIVNQITNATTEVAHGDGSGCGCGKGKGKTK